MAKKKKIKHSVQENCDYFYRDNEMFRTSLDDIEHECDPILTTKNINKTKK